MKKIILGVILLFLLSTNGYSQTEIENLVKEGVQYHDNGEYDKAIETYKRALKIDPNSTLVNYEIAYSYLSKGEYKKAIKYSNAVLKQDDLSLAAYITKGSALDMLGKTKESIKLFDKAIKKLGGHYLLYYNLGLNYYKLNDLENAEENVIHAIELNPNHASSHLMLADIHNQWGNTVQTILASHFFLFLEPTSQRSKIVYSILQQNFVGNIVKDKEMPNNVTIVLSPNNDSQFASAELFISLLEASKSLEENKGKSEDEMFAVNTESFFMLLGETKTEKNKEIWWTFYTTFFYELAKSEHLETYCKYITQIGNEHSKKWIEDNTEALEEFDQWLTSD